MKNEVKVWKRIPKSRYISKLYINFALNKYGILLFILLIKVKEYDLF